MWFIVTASGSEVVSMFQWAYYIANKTIAREEISYSSYIMDKRTIVYALVRSRIYDFPQIYPMFIECVCVCDAHCACV